MKKLIIFLLALFFCSNILFSSNLKINSHFPDVYLNGKYLTKCEKEYLGLPQNVDKFKITQIPSTYKVIEFINIYCFACQKQAPDFNKFFENIKNQKNIKVLGIAIGNSINEIKIFKGKFHIKFPIIPDEKFKVYESIGGTRTPFTIILKNNKVVYGHLSVIENYNELYAVLLDKKTFNKIIQKAKYHPKPLEPNFVISKIKPKFKKIEDVKVYKNYYKVYADGKIFYVVPVSTPSVCNICHPVQFIYIVTSDGKIYDFIPVHLTKRFNVKWTQKEVDEMRARLIGKNILKNIIFNKNVDAVSSATITSSMIFHYINKAKDFLPLKQNN